MGVIINWADEIKWGGVCCVALDLSLPLYSSVIHLAIYHHIVGYEMMVVCRFGGWGM